MIATPSTHTPVSFGRRFHHFEPEDSYTWQLPLRFSGQAHQDTFAFRPTPTSEVGYLIFPIDPPSGQRSWIA